MRTFLCPPRPQQVEGAKAALSRSLCPLPGSTWPGAGATGLDPLCLTCTRTTQHTHHTCTCHIYTPHTPPMYTSHIYTHPTPHTPHIHTPHTTHIYTSHDVYSTAHTPTHTAYYMHTLTCRAYPFLYHLGLDPTLSPGPSPGSQAPVRSLPSTPGGQGSFSLRTGLSSPRLRRALPPPTPD